MSGFDYFEIVGKVIDASIAKIAKTRAVTKEELHRDLIKYLAENRDQWYKKTQPNIRYEDAICRLAYLYAQVAVNGRLIEEVINDSAELQNHIHKCYKNNGQVDVCVFGGGPGTELLGFANWLSKQKLAEPITVDFLLIDRVNEWIASWQSLKETVNQEFRQQHGNGRQNWPCILTGSFQALDMTKPQQLNLSNLEGVFRKDIYIFCYVFSEIHDNQQDLRDFTSTLINQAPDDALFIFIDRRELVDDDYPKWLREIVQLSHQADISLRQHYYPLTGEFPRKAYTKLGKIFDDVTDYAIRHSTSHKGYPRMGWDAFYVLGSKIPF